MCIFWCILADGRHLSISTTNRFEAPVRARAVGASKLFCLNLNTKASAEIAI